MTHAAAKEKLERVLDYLQERWCLAEVGMWYGDNEWSFWHEASETVARILRGWK